MTKPPDLSTRLAYALAWVRGRTDAAPAAGIVLGSGLSGLARKLERATVLPYELIPEFPVSKAPGHLVRIVDHVNLSGLNPLVGENDERIGPRFPDLTEAYDPRLGALLDEVAAAKAIALRSGVYACMLGPSYETPAEIRMLRAIGADVVGMSTVPEVIAARHMGVPVAGISVVTNLAAGLARRTLSHAEVTATAAKVEERLTTLVTGFLGRATR